MAGQDGRGSLGGDGGKEQGWGLTAPGGPVGPAGWALLGRFSLCSAPVWQLKSVLG